MTPTGPIQPPLAGICVIDIECTLPGAMATQFLADCGAEVIMVEPPGGSPLRQLAAWPMLGRGKRSIELDLTSEAGRQSLLDLIGDADVTVETTRPGHSRTGLGDGELHERFPTLIASSITGWGSSGPWRDLKGYEALVMAKAGLMNATRRMQNPPRPGFISVPYASYGAAHTTIHGILSALYEREGSGLGQRVESDLLRGVSAIDTWNWFGELVYLRWPDAYEGIEAWSEDGTPRAPMLLALLAAPTKDGHWLQFAQVSPSLFGAMLDEFGVLPLLADPKWEGFPELKTLDLWREFWGILIDKVRMRTLAEWQQVFIDRPDISAEIFRQGPDVLDHPQLVHEGRVITIDDAVLGPVRQPSTLIHHNEAPLLKPTPAPALNDYAKPAHRQPARAADHLPAGSTEPPLRGVTVLEFGEMFASPYGSSLLADLGARVIKVESMEGDGIRNLLPFPEASGAKVMQGKESVQIDLHTEEGRGIVHELVKHADIVTQSFRAGAAERFGIDEPTLRAINSELVYLSAPGYGTSGPFANRPAYAPSIGAAAGLALTNVPDAADATGTIDAIMAAAPRLTTGTATPEVQGDGLAALCVASAMLVGLLAHRRHGSACDFTTTMIASMTHVLVDWVIDYPDRPLAPRVDADGAGYGALYRQYESSDGWVFLAAPGDMEWEPLADTLRNYVDLKGDARFATPALRVENDRELQDALTTVFAKEPAAQWEQTLTEGNVGCVEVHLGAPSRQLQCVDELVVEYTATAMSPIFDEHLRLGPVVKLSRSHTDPRGGCSAGQHTTAVLTEFGYEEAELTTLRSNGIIVSS
ncbi:CaiB/BaiF CoA-transferase family protein [Mycolicibacterium hodleri]|uniref:CoA transferase n=1 Tax=Mycolicibacterium hodleri TaxID=49897 RepID=A0A502EIK9_9MYCO|nr:CoA transferase [Mycolicibacterium hodleri]TPG37327.1 CoA transferase [Mycolicibacterium hodleri]